jgi:uncharacterized membrane protein
MQTELVSPNLHVVLIHYPLALLIVGTLIEAFSFMWRRSSFRTAGRWMILIGALSTIPATFSGIYALRDVARVSDDNPDIHSWVDVKANSPALSDPAIWYRLRQHMRYQSIVTGVVSLVVLIWLGSSDRLRQSMHALLVLILLGAVGFMICGAWFGGESIYKKGLAVEPVFPPLKTAAPEPATMPASWTTAKTPAEIMFPPLEQHTILAGVAIALALVSMGLSFRKITTMDLIADDPIVTAGPVASRSIPRIPPSPVEISRTFNPDLEVEVRSFVPAGRFWMLTFLLALLTVLSGLFVIARDADILEQMKETPKQIPQLLWTQIGTDSLHHINRHFAHAVGGGAILILPIILALLARFAPRQKWILSFFTLLLACAVAAQIWVGILLLLDTPDGDVRHFNARTPVALHESLPSDHSGS